MSISYFKTIRAYYNQASIIYVHRIVVANIRIDNLTVKNIMVDVKNNDKLLYVDNGKIGYISMSDNADIINLKNRIYKLEQIIKTLTNINL